MPSSITDNIRHVQERIAAGAKRAGRMASQVQLIAVTKYVELPQIIEVLEASVFDLGESRPQHLWKMQEQLQAAVPELAKKVRWHMIGHLQTNKVAETLKSAELIHSGDRLNLLEAIHNQSLKLNRRAKVLLEVNISGDSSKHGFQPDELAKAWEKIISLTGIKICGLMGMSGLASNDDERRREFATLRKLRNRLQSLTAAEIKLNELSMGMSEDFEIAIEEGATMVRVGSALFE